MTISRKGTYREFTKTIVSAWPCFKRKPEHCAPEHVRQTLCQPLVSSQDPVKAMDALVLLALALGLAFVAAIVVSSWDQYSPISRAWRRFKQWVGRDKRG